MLKRILTSILVFIVSFISLYVSTSILFKTTSFAIEKNNGDDIGILIIIISTLGAFLSGMSDDKDYHDFF